MIKENQFKDQYILEIS